MRCVWYLICVFVWIVMLSAENPEQNNNLPQTQEIKIPVDSRLENPKPPERYFIDVSNLQNTITNFGRIGNDGNNSCIWPAGSENNYLYRAGIWIGAKLPNGSIGVSAEDHVAHEWRPSSSIQVNTGISDLDTYTSYTDTVVNSNPLGIEITQRTYTWSGADFILHLYTLRNVGEYWWLRKVYMGMIWDFDISSAAGGSFHADDMTGFFPLTSFSYMFDGDNPDIPGNDTGEGGISEGYIGFSLSGLFPPRTTRTHKFWRNNFDPTTDEERYQLLSGSTFDPPSSEPADYRIFQSVGPFNLWKGQSVIIMSVLAISDLPAELRSIQLSEEVKKIKNTVRQELVTGTGEKLGQTAPNSFMLLPAYPNPFNPSTTIKYILPQKSDVSISIYNTLGERIQTVLEKFQTAGEYHVQWKPENLPSGIYFIHFKAHNFHSVRKIIYTR